MPFKAYVAAIAQYSKSYIRLRGFDNLCSNTLYPQTLVSDEEKLPQKTF